MVQAVADRGRLVAHHANLRLREGVGGGASLKESVTVPGLRDLLAQFAGALAWHGVLSMDIILGPDGPVVIDVNPRLVEPGNALASGVDLVAAMLDVAGASNPPECLPGRDGVRTRQALIGILGAARQEGTRRAIAREACAAVLGTGPYSGSREELTPIIYDPLAAIPIAAAITMTILNSQSWQRFHGGAVGAYALTLEGWRRITETTAESHATVRKVPPSRAT
jgi:hypothetical protein